ncbi:MFS transporter [Rhodothermus marinus]|uniref:MFS transporter n=1 Tax=Rhodothermus marinus TaxID=29549 RepID=UPI0037C821F4
MPSMQKATRIDLFNFRTPQMRAFHMAWFAFFVCFFAWFGIAPLMKVVREELALTPAQVGNTIIASVAVTVLARMLIGRLCDRFGPRRTYAGLLVLGSLPVMAIGLANSYEAFLLFRLAIGVIGASFVITQYHTSLMFAPNIVGTANATTAGWGNLGGGVTQMVMPLVFAGFVGLGFTEAVSWRLAMLVAGLVCLTTGIAYYFLTQDTPEGNFEDLPEHPRLISRGSFRLAARDYRVWVLFVLYAACFGIELTINNVAALYFADYFTLDLKTAGTVAALFGLMNIFARTLGGVVGDLFGRRWGLAGRVRWLFLAILGEGLALILFSQMKLLGLAIATLLLFSLFVQMSEGATYAVVPFLNRKALGSVTGIIGAGGNAGAVLAGFLFKGALPWNQALFLLGLIIIGVAFLAFAVRFSEADERAVQAETARLLAAQPVTA